MAPTWLASARAPALVALGIYVIDAIVVGQGGIALLATLCAVVLGTIDVARGLLGRDRGRIRKGLGSIGVFALMTIAVWGTVRANDLLARSRAEQIITAIRRYRAKHGACPARLSDLVPDDLPAVPRARYTLRFHQFDYHAAEGECGTLGYTAFPPFGRPFYDLKTETWGYLD